MVSRPPPPCVVYTIQIHVPELIYTILICLSRLYCAHTVHPHQGNEEKNRVNLKTLKFIVLNTLEVVLLDTLETSCLTSWGHLAGHIGYIFLDTLEKSCWIQLSHLAGHLGYILLDLLKISCWTPVCFSSEIFLLS